MPLAEKPTRSMETLAPKSRSVPYISKVGCRVPGLFVSFAISLILSCFGSLAWAQNCSTADVAPADGIPDVCPASTTNVIIGDGTDETINGTAGADCIFGQAGNDTINGGDGDDYICGNGGADTINGGNDNDTIRGGGDNDTISGNDGDDELRGNGGDDLINGNDGADFIRGGTGDDNLSGDAGVDDVSGGADNDMVSGGGPPGTDADTVAGGSGNDSCFDDGTDTVSGNCETTLFALVADVRAVWTSPGSVQLSWSASELSTLGYRVWRRPSGGAGRPQLVGVVAARGQSAGKKGYSFVDEIGHLESLDYFLEEFSAAGASRRFGPYFLSADAAIEAPVLPLDVPARLPLRSEVIPSQKQQTEAERSLGVRLRVDRPGIVSVSIAALASTSGHSVEEVRALLDANQVLASWRGAVIAWWLSADKAFLRFYVDEKASLFSRFDTVVLWFDQPGTRAAIAAATLAPPAGHGAIRVSELFAEDVFPGIAAGPSPREDFFFWAGMANGVPQQDEALLPFSLEAGALSEQVTLSFKLFGVSVRDEAFRSLQVDLNQVPVGKIALDTHGTLVRELVVPTALLAKDNVVRLRFADAVSVSAAPPLRDALYVDSLRVAYDRTSEIQAEALGFQAEGDLRLSWSGDDEAVILDVSDPALPQRIQPQVGAREIDLTNTSPRPFFFARTFVTPQLEPVLANRTMLLNEEAEYLVVAPQVFKREAEALAKIRRDQGLSGRVIPLESVLTSTAAVNEIRWQSRPFLPMPSRSGQESRSIWSSLGTVILTTKTTYPRSRTIYLRR